MKLKEITIPTEWADLTISQYMKIKPIHDSNKNRVEKSILFLAVISGKPTQDIETINVSVLNKVSDKLSFLDTDPQGKFRKVIKVGGKSFKIVLNSRELNGGQYMSVVTKLKQAKDDDEWIFENLHELLSSISLPAYGKQSHDYYLKTSELFYNEMTMDVAMPIAFFFSSLYKNLMKIIRDSSKRKLQKATTIIEEMETDLLNVGGGSPH